MSPSDPTPFVAGVGAGYGLSPIYPGMFGGGASWIWMQVEVRANNFSTRGYDGMQALCWGVGVFPWLHSSGNQPGLHLGADALHCNEWERLAANSRAPKTRKHLKENLCACLILLPWDAPAEAGRGAQEILQACINEASCRSLVHRWWSPQPGGLWW